MKTLLDIVNRLPRPDAWSEGDNIPWDDPGFSERMLAEHLSQEHDLASRRSETIDSHVEWIFSTVLGGRPGRVLDLGCGPGLYTERLARRGCECVGVDFSPASIRYASEVATAAGSACRYVHRDLRDGDFGTGFDLVMMIYGQFNVFPRDTAQEILKHASFALAPGGRIVLEVHSTDLIERVSSADPTWYAAETGLFSDRPHIVLQENFWDEAHSVSTTRFMVVDGATGAVDGYALSNEAYTDRELDEVLRAAGFEGAQSFGSLDGRESATEDGFPVVVAVRRGPAAV